MRRWVAGFALFFVGLQATGLRAQTTPAPQQAPPSPPAAGGWGASPAYGGYQSGYGPSPQAYLMYESGKKTPAVALLIEIFLPGVGSLYADHARGALVTWALMIAGVGLMVMGLRNALEADVDSNGSSSADATPLWLGLGLMVGGRIHGLYDSYTATKDFNRALAARLGLDGMQVSLAPIRMGEVTAWGPALGFRF